jgi:hypothetical protein
MLGDLRRGQGRLHSAAHSHPVDTQSEPLARLGVPAVHERHSHRERRTRDAEQEPKDDERRERVVEQGQQHERTDAVPHQQGEHKPSAVPVSQDPHRNAHERAENNRDRDHQRELEVGQVQMLLQRRAQRTEHAPREEADSERNQRDAEGDRV